MKLSKFAKIFLIIFDMALLTYIIDNFVRDLFPVTRPVFWIAVVVEIGLGILTYHFWMRSLLVKGFKRERITALVLLVVGSFAPLAIDLMKIEFLRPAVNSDIFYFGTAVSLAIYSSYTVDKYLAKHKITKAKEG